MDDWWCLSQTTPKRDGIGLGWNGEFSLILLPRRFPRIRSLYQLGFLWVNLFSFSDTRPRKKIRIKSTNIQKMNNENNLSHLRLCRQTHTLIIWYSYFVDECLFLVDTWWDDDSIVFRVQKENKNTILFVGKCRVRVELYILVEPRGKFGWIQVRAKKIKLWDRPWDGWWRRPQGFIYAVSNWY